jgi:hypothetical protein
LLIVDPTLPESVNRRRRFWIAVPLGVIILLCAGGLLVPAVLFLQATEDAGNGGTTPVEAVDVYLLELPDDDDLGLRRVLAADHRDQLLDQRRSIRDAMKGTDPPVSKLGWSDFDVDERGDDATVTVPVSGTWWPTDGHGPSWRSAAYPWRFETHRDRDGWRIRSVDAPAWCGTYVRADVCR